MTEGACEHCALDRGAGPAEAAGDVLPPRLVGVRRPIVLSWAAGLACASAAVLAGREVVAVRLGLFTATLAAELAALAIALASRRALPPDDPTRFAASAIAVGLGLRMIAETRLLLMYVDAVPQFLRDDPLLWSLYFYGLRYCYAAADVALLAGCVRTLGGLRSTGLGFRLGRQGALALLLLAPLPLVVHALQSGLAAVDPDIFTFRLIAASVGAIVAVVCVALASAALQMGGGAWPWIWGAAAAAGIARVLAFVAAAAAHVLPGGLVVEQALLWTFACAWLLATALQRRLLARR
jgi:hypothetical protein